MSIIIPVLIILTAYIAIVLEISTYWDYAFYKTAINIPHPEYNGIDTKYSYDLYYFQKIWVINFSILFVSLISHAIISFKRPTVYAWIAQSLNYLVLFLFLLICLLKLSDLRVSYLNAATNEYFKPGIYYILVRYISILFFALLLVTMRRLIVYLDNQPRIVFDLIICGSILWLLCSELLHWLDLAKLPDSYKLALSILFGVYALAMVVYGIWKDSKHIRLAAFALIGITLLKLFFYDLANLSPISRAVIMIVLGLLMLGVSFLYIKFKNKIFDETHIKQ
jgi:uncharacterized membrane protein